MTPLSTAVQPLTVAEIADALMGVESSAALLARLEDLLARLGALPARVYLFDADSGSFYAAAGLGCAKAAPEIPLLRPDAAPAHHHLLRSCGEWVGLLEILTTEPHDRNLVALLAALLGPTLIAVHRQAGLIDEVTQLGREVRELVTAGELLRHLDVEVLLSRILETAIFAVRAQVGAVLIADEQDRLTVGAALGLSEEHIAAIQGRDGRSIAAVVQDGGLAICVGADEVRERLDLTALEAQGVSLTGLLALPLTIRGRGRGVVLLANPEGDFNAGERRIAETVCSLAAIALDNALLVKGTLDRERLQRELDLAHSVQEQMYPDGGLTLGGLTVAGSSQPCDETGGDYYTYLTRNGCVLAMIGDVSGHGLGAALYTTMAHAIIQQQLRAGAALEPAFGVLNEGLFHTQSGRFMTAALVEIEPQTLAITYVSAGHNPLLWIHAGAVRWLESCGMPLGIVPVGDFPPPPGDRLAPGDMLILYTDGFVEAVNGAGEVYGDERFAAAALIAWREGMGPAETVALITTEVDVWSAGHKHEDDLTMVVVRVAAGTGGRAGEGV
ncbi:MAG: SpoIIE family protein phosphatase [Planctomycetes bacterium]|nr:SpoIIE family protein phosphatase [Planctomycetota bacterium]